MELAIENKNHNSYLKKIQELVHSCGSNYLSTYQKLEKHLNEIFKNKEILKEQGFDLFEHIISEKYSIAVNCTHKLEDFFNEHNEIFNEVLAESIYSDNFIHFIDKLNQIRENIFNLNLKIDIYFDEYFKLKKVNLEEAKQKIEKLDIFAPELNNLYSEISYNFDAIINNSNVVMSDIRIRIEQKLLHNNSQFQNKFNELTSLIIKKHENEIQLLTDSFKTQIKNLSLDLESAKKSNDLLKKDTDSSYKKIIELNEKFKNIELQYSKIIGTETEKIKNELKGAKTIISNQIDSITSHVQEKSKAIETAHSDFILLVEKAGIYELTKNYEKKGNEEKKEYKDYRLYTSISIILAIVSTIAVFAFAFWEQSQLPDNSVVNTNYLLLVSRLSISLMFFVLALYLSKQASKHYECYQENHRTFLQLAALEPFMARMTPEEQKEIRKGLIPSYFNQANEGKYASKGDEVDLSSNMTTIFNSLIEKIPSKKESESSNKPEGTAG